MYSRLLMRCSTAIVAAALVATSVSVFAVQTAVAQSAADTGSARGGRGGRVGGGAGFDKDRGPNQGPSRETVELWQKKYEEILRKQVTFSDEQIVKWRAWNARFDIERRPMFIEEREIRRTLRMQLARGVTPDEAKVVDAMDRWAKLERKRLDLKERENKVLSGFLSPIQRARFFALQDDVERGFREADGRRDGGRGDGMNRDGGGRGGPPPQMRGDSAAIAKFRQGMRGDSAGGKFPRAGVMRPPGKVDTLSLAKPVKN